MKAAFPFLFTESTSQLVPCLWVLFKDGVLLPLRSGRRPRKAHLGVDVSALTLDGQNYSESCQSSWHLGHKNITTQMTQGKMKNMGFVNKKNISSLSTGKKMLAKFQINFKF